MGNWAFLVSNPCKSANSVSSLILVSRILENLLSSTPDDLPPIENCSVSKQLGLLSRAVFYDAYTCRKLLEFGGREPKEDGYYIRVNRAEFRGWLSKHIHINWNKRFSHYEEIDSGVTAYFHDGTSAAGSIWVGADGINSPGMTDFSLHVESAIADGDKSAHSTP